MPLLALLLISLLVTAGVATQAFSSSAVLAANSCVSSPLSPPLKGELPRGGTPTSLDAVGAPAPELLGKIAADDAAAGTRPTTRAR